MSDRLVVAAAALAAALAVLAPALPVAVAVALVLVALATRRPGPLAVALALVVGARAHVAVADLARPLPPRLAGTAVLAGDPEPGWFGTRVVLRLGGRRWSADVARDDEAVVRPLLTGDHVVVRGSPRAFRDVPRGWVLSRHLAGRLAVDRVGRGPPAPPWYRLANGLHRTLDAGASSLGDDHRALFLGLVLGDDRLQSDLTRYRFRSSGLAHLLAVSGQNVAFLLAVCRPVLMRCPPSVRIWLGLGALSLFVLATRAEPSVLRAAAMAAVALWGTSAGRVVPASRLVGLAVLGLLLVDPLLVHSTGFRLSVAATLGLLVLARPLAARLPGPRWLAEPLSVTLAAQLATAPVLLTFTDGVPVVATVANLLAVPPAGAVMALGLTTGLAAGLVHPGLAAVLQWPTGVLVGWVDLVASTASRVPLRPLDAAAVTALGACAAAGWATGRRRRSGGPAGPSALRSAVRAVAALVALAVVLGAVPRRAAPGVHRLPGVAATVWPCGEVAVEVEAGPVDDVLAGLRSLGVVSATRVTGSDPRVVGPVATQLGAAIEASGAPCSVRP